MSYKMREKCAFLSIADCTLVGQRRRPKTETETEGNLVSADERLTKDGRTEWNGMGWNRGSGVDGRNGKKKDLKTIASKFVVEASCNLAPPKYCQSRRGRCPDRGRIGEHIVELLPRPQH